MKKRYYAMLSILATTLFLGACQSRMFGLDEAVWNTLSEQEREKIIDGYNKREEIELLNAQKRKEKELENERQRLELEAQTAPIHAVAGAISSIWGDSNSKSKCSASTRIQSISSNHGQKVLTIGDERFEVSVFSRMSQAWVKGQKVELTKDKDEVFYPVKIRNMDNGESVNARKSESLLLEMP